MKGSKIFLDRDYSKDALDKQYEERKKKTEAKKSQHITQANKQDKKPKRIRSSDDEILQNLKYLKESKESMDTEEAEDHSILPIINST